MKAEGMVSPIGPRLLAPRCTGRGQGPPAASKAKTLSSLELQRPAGSGRPARPGEPVQARDQELPREAPAPPDRPLPPRGGATGRGRWRARPGAGARRRRHWGPGVL